MSLFSAQPNLVPLRESILRVFKGKQVSIEDLRDWDYRRDRILANSSEASNPRTYGRSRRVSVVNPSVKRRKGTFSDGTILKFS